MSTAATSTDSAAAFSLPPPGQRSPVEHRNRPRSPAMATVPDERPRDAPAPDVIYTPTTTTTSSRSSSTAEEHPAAQPGERSTAVWSDWWMAEELAAQVGSLSKELAELKEMMSRQRARDEGSAESSDDVSRLKSNHRSSLASLADCHRTEIAKMSSAHRDEVMKLELQHLNELRSARRSHGVDQALVKGLHESYGKQIENLILDLSEARQENEEMKLKTALAVSKETRPPSPAEAPRVTPEFSTRSLSMIVTFEDLDPVFSAVELSIPHPGKSFHSLLRCLCYTVRNHLQALNTAAIFFASGTKNLVQRSKIRRWYQSALEERVHFKMSSQGNNTECFSVEESWEDEHWASDNFVLQVNCASDAWNEVPVEEHDDNTVILDSTETITPTAEPVAELGVEPEPVVESVSDDTVEPLVSVETPTRNAFNPAVELERINKELSQLQMSRERQTRMEEEATAQLRYFEEHKENLEPSLHPVRKVTVETIKDEDDPPTPTDTDTTPRNDRRASDIPLPRVVPVQTPMEAWAQEVFVKTTEQVKSATTEREVKTSKGPKSSDSWLFDEIFSPVSTERVDRSNSLEAINEDESHKDNSETRLPRSSNPFARTGGFRDDKSESLADDGPFKTPPTGSAKEDHVDIQMKQYWEEVGKESFLERLRQEELEEDERLRSMEQRQASYTLEEMTDRPFFNILDERANLPTPPPAPEATGNTTPTVPAQANTESVVSSHATRLDEDYGHSEKSAGDTNNPENPFAEPARCETPVLDTARSVVSTTPLLADDVTGRKSGLHAHFSPPAPIAPLDDDRTGSPPPFAPLSGSPRSRDFFRRYSTFRTTEDNGDAPSGQETHWETGSEGSTTSVENYESESVRGQKKCGHGEGPEAYTWRHRKREEGFRTRSASPSPSRSSETTTDRQSDSVLRPTIYPNYPPHFPGIVGGSDGSNGGSFRWGPHPMGPLGPQNLLQAQQMDIFIRHMQHQQLREALAKNNTSNRSGGPVYAPNPPHSVTPFPTNNLPGPIASGVPVSPPRIHYDNMPWLLRSPPGLPAPHPPQNWNGHGVELRPGFNYSGDASAPMQWKLEHNAPFCTDSMMPPQVTQLPNTSIDMLGNFPNALAGAGPWNSGFGALPSTPGSHPSAHSHRQSQTSWYPLPQQQPPQQPLTPQYEFPWNNGMPMPTWH